MIETFRNWTRSHAIVADNAYGSSKIMQQIADEGGLGRPPRLTLRICHPDPPDAGTSGAGAVVARSGASFSQQAELK